MTGEQRYLDQAALFVDRRGRGTLGEIGFGQAYFQDDVPIRDATVFRGHAVRALYLAAGAVDVAVETGDDALLATLIAQWEATIARRTYLTGGMGSHHTGEAFGDDFVLPPDRAYSETCAGIASMMLAWRLLLATGEPRFADLFERTLHNVVATSPAPDGRALLLRQPAAPAGRRGPCPPEDEESKRASTSLRAPWFLVACCPTNVARTLASLAAYLATADDGGIQVHQYADVPDPHDARRWSPGRRLDVCDRLPGRRHRHRAGRPRPTARPWALTLRVPPWASGAELVDPSGGRRPVSPGTAVVERPFAAGDEITLDAADGPALDEARPADRRGARMRRRRARTARDVRRVRRPARRSSRRRATRRSVGAAARRRRLRRRGGPPRRAGGPAWPYGDDVGTEPARPTTDVPLVPYHRWANRGPSTMRVWMPTRPTDSPFLHLDVAL